MDPVLLDVGLFQVYWYGFMYILAFLAFWSLAYYRIQKSQIAWDVARLNDACFYISLGVVAGGRLGYVLFYGFEQFLDDPMWLFRIWEGGMSFHGGLLGVIGGVYLWSWKASTGFWATMDTIAPLVPLGLGIGRIGNFINAELPGRVTDSPLGVHFPCSSVAEHNFLCTGMFEDAARHVSSLYQATAEGVVLFVALWIYAGKPRQTGQVAAAFLLGYGALRIITEFFREPDAFMGFVLFGWVSMGQALSGLMLLGGCILLVPAVARHFARRQVA